MAMPLIEHQEQIIVDVVTLDPYNLETFKADSEQVSKKEKYDEKMLKDLGTHMPMTF